jgi:hypothetical protein
VPDCPRGDPTCPCQDGDACQYEATATTPAWTPPTRIFPRPERTGETQTFPRPS